MVKAKTQRLYVNTGAVERIDFLVKGWKAQLGIKSLWIFSPGGNDTKSTAETLQSKFGEGSNFKFHLEKDPYFIAKKARELSLARPVIVIMKDSASLHRVARELDIPIDYGTFRNSEGVVLDITRKTSEIFTAE